MISRLFAYAIVVAAVVFGFFIPIQVSRGVIDTTANLCLGSTTAQTKRYHVLLGQWNDYKIVKSHLVPSSACGQPVVFELYL